MAASDGISAATSRTLNGPVGEGARHRVEVGAEHLVALADGVPVLPCLKTLSVWDTPPCFGISTAAFEAFRCHERPSQYRQASRSQDVGRPDPRHAQREATDRRIGGPRGAVDVDPGRVVRRRRTPHRPGGVRHVATDVHLVDQLGVCPRGTTKVASDGPRISNANTPALLVIGGANALRGDADQVERLELDPDHRHRPVADAVGAVGDDRAAVLGQHHLGTPLRDDQHGVADELVALEVVAAQRVAEDEQLSAVLEPRARPDVSTRERGRSRGPSGRTCPAP